MNILVFLKLVSQAQFSDSLSDSGDRLTGGQLGINPADLYALELALRIKDSDTEAILTVVSMAPELAEPSLREALAMGADRAVLINDRRIVGSDTLATARVLAAAVSALGPQQLILCGKKAIDSETGHIGPQLSAMLGLPLAANVVSFSCREGRVSLLRAGDRGLCRYEGPLPAVLTVCNGVEMVRRPTIAGLRRGRQSRIERLDLDALGLSADAAGLGGSPTRTVEIADMSFRRGDNVRAASAEAGVRAILGLLEGAEHE